MIPFLRGFSPRFVYRKLFVFRCHISSSSCRPIPATVPFVHVALQPPNRPPSLACEWHPPGLSRSRNTKTPGCCRCCDRSTSNTSINPSGPPCKFLSMLLLTLKGDSNFRARYFQVFSPFLLTIFGQSRWKHISEPHADSKFNYIYCIEFHHNFRVIISNH